MTSMTPGMFIHDCNLPVDQEPVYVDGKHVGKYALN